MRLQSFSVFFGVSEGLPCNHSSRIVATRAFDAQASKE
jgi:hypothetical protein